MRLMAMARPELDPGQSTLTVTVEVVHRIA
jgi:hypothetical protein